MGKISDIFDAFILRVPKHQKVNEQNNTLETAFNRLENLDLANMRPEEKCELLLEQRKEIINEVITRNKLSEKQINSSVLYDFAFLKSFIKNWDQYDVAFVALFVGIYIAVMQGNAPNIRHEIKDGKNIHDAHNRKPKANSAEDPNSLHYKMPNDTIPGHSPGGSAKVNGESFNHRYLFGHDILKPWEIFKDLNSIPFVSPVLGSKKLGAIIKQIIHLFYDTFSETGLPAPGSTYFIKLLSHFMDNDTFMKYYSVHIEDIYTNALSLGTEALIYIYFRTRQLMDQYGTQINEPLKAHLNEIFTVDLKNGSWKTAFMTNRTFKEYEFGMIIHSLIIWYQLIFLKDFRGSLFVNQSAKLLIKDLIQYIRLNIKWNENYKSMIICELQNIISVEILEDDKPKYKRMCMAIDIDYSDNAFELLEYMEQFLNRYDKFKES
jgi:hypothetical protein